MNSAFSRLKQRTVEAIAKGASPSDGPAVDAATDESVEDMQNLKEGLDAVTKSCENAMCSRRKADIDRKRNPHLKLSEALQNCGGRVSARAPHLKAAVELVGRMEEDLAMVSAQYEQNIDIQFLQQVHNLVDKDIRPILAERKELESLRLDRDAAKGRMVAALNGQPEKIAASEAQYQACKERFEDLQASLVAQTGRFWDREKDMASYLLVWCEAQTTMLEESAMKARATLEELQASLDETHRLFGRAIIDYVEEYNLDVPEIVQQCIQTLSLHGIEEVGIFRMSGNVAVVKALKRYFESGGPVDLSASRWALDHNEISGVLKLYFRELPNPLLDLNLYDQWLAAIKIPDHDQKLYSLFEVLQRLPPAHYRTLKTLVCFLAKVVQHGDDNKMFASNLGIVFGPTLLWQNVDGSNPLTDSAALANLVETLITYSSWFFAQEPDAEASTISPGAQPRAAKAMLKRDLSASLPAFTQTKSQPMTSQSAVPKSHHVRSFSGTADLRGSLSPRGLASELTGREHTGPNMPRPMARPLSTHTPTAKPRLPPRASKESKTSAGLASLQTPPPRRKKNPPPPVPHSR